MPATKTIALAGGTLTLTTTAVNWFDSEDHERKLLDDIRGAIRTFERQAQSVQPTAEPVKVREESGTR